MTSISLDELRQRIIAIRTGDLPANAVTDEEIRAGIEQLRADRKAKATASSERKVTATAPTLATPSTASAT